MKYRQGFLNEVDRFERCCAIAAARNDCGLHQFFEFESRGVQPAAADPYFLRLLGGKRFWEWQLNNIAETYCTSEWVGWYQIATDYVDDLAGLNQLRQRLRFPPVSTTTEREAYEPTRIRVAA